MKKDLKMTRFVCLLFVVGIFGCVEQPAAKTSNLCYYVPISNTLYQCKSVTNFAVGDARQAVRGQTAHDCEWVGLVEHHSFFKHISEIENIANFFKAACRE